MGHLIKVGNDWTQEGTDRLKRALEIAGIDEFVIVADENFEVFEYDELENVTIYEDEIAEELGLESDSEAVKFIEEGTLQYGME